MLIEVGFSDIILCKGGERVEYFDIVDAVGRPTGDTVERSEAHRLGIRHRTSHIWVIRRNAGRVEVLLQQRSFGKDSFPGLLDTSSAGHIQAGDEPLDSALREMSEELGIRAKADELHYIGCFDINYTAEFHGRSFTDNEISFVYTYEKPVDINTLEIQKEELESVGWFGLDETIERVKAHDARYCVPIEGLMLVKKYISSDPFATTLFRRRFSVNPYKSLRLPLGEMNCVKDWVNTKRGDPYPILEKGEVTELVADGAWRIRNDTGAVQRVRRLLGGHFPVSTYDIGLEELTGKAGITIEYPEKRIELLVSHDGSKYIFEVTDSDGRRAEYMLERPFASGARFMVTANFTRFELYIADPTPVFVAMHHYPEFEPINRTSVYTRSTAAITVELASAQEAALNAEFYLDCGVSQADLRSVRYEDGTPVIERGRMFLTFSVRNIDGGFQGVMSWTPGLADFRMEGALFFDPGDGKCAGDDRMCGDVATTLIYDRIHSEWLLWACSFSHGHILCHTRMKNDPRFGINVLDVQLMKAENTELTLSDDRLFLAKAGDEDPDLVWDAENNRWLMSICRLVTLENGDVEYRYFVFEGNDPFEGFTYIGNTTEGSGTGGSLIMLDGKRYLLSGANFRARANYWLYPLDALDTHTRLDRKSVV